MEINKETLLENICLLDDFSPLLYEIDRNNHANLLGKGSCATVFKAKLIDKGAGAGLPEEVAVKEVMWDGKEAYKLAEWAFLKQKRAEFMHPNVVCIYCISTTELENARQYKYMQQMFMELCDESLQADLEFI